MEDIKGNDVEGGSKPVSSEGGCQPATPKKVNHVLCVPPITFYAVGDVVGRVSPKKASLEEAMEVQTVPPDPNHADKSPAKGQELTVEPLVVNLKDKIVTTKKTRSRKRKAAEELGVYEEEYEVEKVIDHRKSNGDRVDMYKVKWKGWDDQYNSWEPLEHVRTSLAAIADYYQSMVYPGRGDFVLKCQVEALRAALTPLDDKVISEFCYKYLTQDGHSITIDENLVEDNLAVLSRIPPFARDAKMLADVRSQLQLVEFKRRREKQLELLRTWEAEINAMSSDKAPVQIFNSVDLDVLDGNFIFVNENIPDCNVAIPDNNPLACDCKGNCFKKSCCWNGSLQDEPPYTKDGRLRYDRGAPIYECNKNCKCGPDCGNRVLQKGRTVRLAIFKTNNGCGWGVRTLEPIKKGTFVVEYVGQIVTSEIAEIRGRTYDKNGCTYLFDLDFDSEDSPYTIDAAVYGNVSHFINHSCEPNLTVFAVWVDCMDSNLPRLGLYANRNIKAFEQLSFDYMMEKPSPKNPNKKDGKQTLCQCNAKNCRKLVF